ncbi:hypothetical protein Dcar01_02585 [Deinococcus carri]|uniref:Uncharacterized protein n=1 Tax=Deinococcus carri TaxID=1211323 RepID=A0ABP9W909_9DEIO
MSRPGAPEPAPHTEPPVLPPWLYPACFWLALPVLALSLAVPGLVDLGVWFMMAVPALAALVVVVTRWRTDRRVAVAALVALIGLAVVVVVKQFLRP